MADVLIDNTVMGVAAEDLPVGRLAYQTGEKFASLPAGVPIGSIVIWFPTTNIKAGEPGKFVLLTRPNPGRGTD